MRQRLGVAAWGALGGVVIMLLMGTQWTTPRTWVFRELVTESMLNQHVRDNLLHLKENQNALGGLFSGIHIGTHIDSDIAAKTVQLRRAERIVFDDGSAENNLTPLTADITLAGAGGLDTGSEAASTWYEIYAIRNSSTTTKSLMLHRAKDFFLDETYDSDDATILIRNVTDTRTALGQGFAVSNTGYLDFVDVEIIRNNAPSGTLYAEIHSDAAGLPSGTVLATSDKLVAGDVATSSQWVRFVFRTPVSLTAATTYHLVLTGSWTPSDSVYVAWRCDTSAASYANGTRTQKDGGTWINTGVTAHDFSFKIYIRRNDASVTMPSGYDGKCLIGYVYNDGSSNFTVFTAVDRRVSEAGNIVVGGSDAIPSLKDISAFVPPVPVTFTGFSNAQSAGITWIAPVPIGFKTPAGVRDVLSAGSSLGNFLLDVQTETQGVYAHDTSGTYDLLMYGYEW